MTDNPSITIKNFKSYKNATLPLSPLTLLIGANASGKSNAIEAFRFLSWVAGGERLSTLKNRVNDSDKVVRGSIRDLAFNSMEQFALIFQNEDTEYEGVFNVSSNSIELTSEVIRSQENKIFVLKSLKYPYFAKISKFLTTDLIDEVDKIAKRNNGLDNFLSSDINNYITIHKNENSDISEFLMVDKNIAILDHLNENKNKAWIDFDDIRKFLQ